MSDYQSMGGGLKLKGLKKKKKKKTKNLDTLPESAKREAEQQLQEAASKAKARSKEQDTDDGMTPAERAFARVREERELKLLKKKAMTSHREQVEKLNAYLDNLSEHHDIPKVSWTK